MGGLELNAMYERQPDEILVLDAWNGLQGFKRQTGVGAGRRRHGGRQPGGASGVDSSFV